MDKLRKIAEEIARIRRDTPVDWDSNSYDSLRDNYMQETKLSDEKGIFRSFIHNDYVQYGFIIVGACYAIHYLDPTLFPYLWENLCIYINNYRGPKPDNDPGSTAPLLPTSNTERPVIRDNSAASTSYKGIISTVLETLRTEDGEGSDTSSDSGSAGSHRSAVEVMNEAYQAINSSQETVRPPSPRSK